MRECKCGSGLEKEAQYDARGIFLFYGCSQCVKLKLSKFRPDVLHNPNYIADEAIEEEELL